MGLAPKPHEELMRRVETKTDAWYVANLVIGLANVRMAVKTDASCAEKWVTARETVQRELKYARFAEGLVIHSKSAHSYTQVTTSVRHI
eukprot:CAMPEP_0169149610 /NCGR_PEP_ID=MMETSP1015-20121227/49640_1 /TAXON_ID=342587 /ORGANISM="Karlodinium micrum, Strain CCMP2283" /LENGTH=88 /DNA_ID=CAMNT_0009218485 /DNA_START=912 /DNA_END=1175 /DNA_ORIENTATION=+